MNNEDDDAVGVCTECGNQQPDKYMFNSVFAQEGHSAVCKYCGGTVAVCYRSEVQQVLQTIKRKRGLG
jgi:DNA-directed RNA polymerase subunit RPC12/RpoP